MLHLGPPPTILSAEATRLLNGFVVEKRRGLTLCTVLTWWLVKS